MHGVLALKLKFCLVHDYTENVYRGHVGNNCLMSFDFKLFTLMNRILFHLMPSTGKTGFFDQF